MTAVHSTGWDGCGNNPLLSPDPGCGICRRSYSASGTRSRTTAASDGAEGARSPECSASRILLFSPITSKLVSCLVVGFPNRCAASQTWGRGSGSRNRSRQARPRPDDPGRAPRAADRGRPWAVRRAWSGRHLGRGDRRPRRGQQAGGLRALRRQGRALRGRRRSRGADPARGDQAGPDQPSRQPACPDRAGDAGAARLHRRQPRRLPDHLPRHFGGLGHHLVRDNPLRHRLPGGGPVGRRVHQALPRPGDRAALRADAGGAGRAGGPVVAGHP